MKIKLYSNLRGIMFGFQIFNTEPFEFEGLKFERALSLQIYVGFIYVVVSTDKFNLGFLNE